MHVVPTTLGRSVGLLGLVRLVRGAFVDVFDRPLAAGYADSGVGLADDTAGPGRLLARVLASHYRGRACGGRRREW
jgi:hypothetical protein